MGAKKPKPVKRAELARQTATLAWLHAELLHQLGHVITLHSNAIQTIAWLFAEKNFHLEQFIASEDRLIRRAKAVKEAQQRAAAGPAALNGDINPAAMRGPQR